MTIQESYMAYLSEAMSKDDFVYFARKDRNASPFLSRANTADDVISILKSKNVISEPPSASVTKNFDVTNWMTNRNMNVIQEGKAVEYKKYDSIDLNQLLKGAAYEYDTSGRNDWDKAYKKAGDNLVKNPLYYVEKIFGVKNPTKDSDLRREVSKSNLVDKENGMKPVKKKISRDNTPGLLREAFINKKLYLLKEEFSEREMQILYSSLYDFDPAKDPNTKDIPKSEVDALLDKVNGLRTTKDDEEEAKNLEESNYTITPLDKVDLTLKRMLDLCSDVEKQYGKQSQEYRLVQLLIAKHFDLKRADPNQKPQDPEGLKKMLNKHLSHDNEPFGDKADLRKHSVGNLAPNGRLQRPHLNEKHLSKAEDTEKEKVVHGLKKKAAEFKKKYGKKWKSVMYAVATKAGKKLKETNGINKNPQTLMRPDNLKETNGIEKDPQKLMRPDNLCEKINNPKYKFYVVDREQVKLVSGWEYREDAFDFVKHKGEKDHDKKRLVVLTKANVIKMGLKPEDDNSWGKEPSMKEATKGTDPLINMEPKNKKSVKEDSDAENSNNIHLSLPKDSLIGRSLLLIASVLRLKNTDIRLNKSSMGTTIDLSISPEDLNIIIGKLKSASIDDPNAKAIIQKYVDSLEDAKTHKTKLNASGIKNDKKIAGITEDGVDILEILKNKVNEAMQSEEIQNHIQDMQAMVKMKPEELAQKVDGEYGTMSNLKKKVACKALGAAIAKGNDSNMVRQVFQRLSDDAMN